MPVYIKIIINNTLGIHKFFLKIINREHIPSEYIYVLPNVTTIKTK